MNKDSKNIIWQAGGSIIRLFLFVIALFSFDAKAQISVHYSSTNLSLNTATKELSGTVSVALTNQGDSVYSNIKLLYWPLAYQQMGTKLAAELLENQNARLRFSKAEDCGKTQLSVKIIRPDQTSQPLNITEELTVIQETLKPGQTLNLRFELVAILPNAVFNGYGVSTSTLRLSHWLPRISAANNTQNDAFNSSNREAWFYPATYDLQLSLSEGVNICTNLKLVPTPKSAKPFYHLRSTQPQTDALIFLFANGTRFPIQNDSTTVLLFFSGDFPAFNTNSTVSKTKAFLKRELGMNLPDSLKIVFVENKGGLQSAGNCIVLEKNSTQENVEGDLVAELVEVYARDQLHVNPVAHPFLVEGLGNYYKHLYFNVHYPNKMLLGPLANTFAARFLDVDHYPISYQNRMLYLYMVRQGLDQPLSDAAPNYSRFNREAVIRGKSALWFSYLRSYVGEKNWLRGMRRWAQTSDGSPESLIAAMQYYHNQDVGWFLGDLYATSKKVDYALKKTDRCTSVYTATIKNKGNLDVPFSTTGYQGQKTVLTEWHEGFTGKKTIQIHYEDYSEVKIDAANAMPETRQRNNTARTKGIFKTLPPPALQFYTSFENPKTSQLFWLPSVKYNAYDQLLIGAQFTNANLFKKSFEWKLAPDFSTGTGTITGMGSLRFNLTPYNGPFHLISFGLYGKYYHYAPELGYMRLSPTVNFHFRKAEPRSEWINTLRMRAILVNRESSTATDAVQLPIVEGPLNYRILDLRYHVEKGALLNPFIGFADVQVADDFVKLSLEVKQRWRVSKNHLFTVRAFAGTILHNNTPDPYFQFGLSGTRDYLFDYYFIGRSDQSGVWSQQMFFSDGGFRTQTNTFTTSLLAANLNLPLYRFIGLFGDVGYSFNNTSPFWDYGVYLEFIPDFIEIHFPIAGSQKVFVQQNDYIKNVRFVLNLELDAIVNRIRRGWY